MILLPALGLGFAGSLHCVGMCGPIALAVPAGSGSKSRKLAAYALYHTGRISAYAILGFLFGVLGYGLSTAGFQQTISIAAGVFMLLFIWVPRFAGATSLGGRLASLQNKVLGRMSKLIKQHRAQALIGLGFFNGLLPCGLVYLALAGALVSYDPFAGAAFMALFGLGTVPALLALALTGNAIDISWRTRLRKVAPVIATAIALLFILRGLGLGIPFISPEIGHTVAADHICIP